MSAIRLLLRVLFVFLLAAGAAVIPSGSASAHTSVDATLPEDGAVLEVAPPDVLIAFNEVVTMASDAAKLTDAAGKTTILPAAVVEPDNAGSKARIAPFPAVENGWYAVSWTAISADGHPINGTFTFFVGDPNAASAAERVKTEEIADPTAPYLALAPALRAVSYLATILAVGALCALWALSSKHNPMPEKVRGRARKLAAWAAGAGLVATPLTLMNNAIILNGGSFEALWPTARLILQSSGGAALLIRMSALFGICTAVLLLMERATRKIGAGIVVVSAVALFFSFAMAGHASVIEDNENLAYVAQVMHLLAAAVWLGGIPAVLMAIWSRKEISLAQAAEAVDRFSKLATVSVILVIVGGLILSYTMFTSLEDLVTTTYGLMLIGKVAVVSLVAVVGAYNHFVVVPAMRKEARRSADEENASSPPVVNAREEEADTQENADALKPEEEPAPRAADEPPYPEQAGVAQDSGRARSHMRATMLTETGALVVILAITSVMTTSPAPKAAGNHLEHLGLVHSHAGGPGALSADLELALADLEPTIYSKPLGGGELELSIAPGRAGADNRIVLTAYGRSGRVRDMKDATLKFTQEELQLGPIERTMESQGDGTFLLTGRDLGVKGPWAVRVDIEFPNGTRDFAEFEVLVKPPSSSAPAEVTQ